MSAANPNKAELTAQAAALGLDVPEEWTKREISEAIRELQASTVVETVSSEPPEHEEEPASVYQAELVKPAVHQVGDHDVSAHARALRAVAAARTRRSVRSAQ